MQPPFDIAADLDTPVSAYLKLAPFKPRFLLESVEGGERVGRYSFIGFGDVQSLRLAPGAMPEGVPGESTQAVVLNFLRDALSKAPRLTPEGVSPAALPFHGGLVGVTAFDLVRRFERIPDPRALGDQPMPDLALMAPKSMLVFDHLSRRVALLHDGSEAERRSLRSEIIRALRGATPARGAIGGVGELIPSLSREAFIEGVERIKGHIHAGDLYQLVLSARFEGPCDLEPFQVYRALRLLNPSPYLYFCDFGDLQVVGSSPEALVKLDGRKATLRPIAGTRPRGADDASDLAMEEELKACPKEAAEHVMLVDLARNDLGRVAEAGTVKVNPSRIIERYSHVMHLVSGVEGILKPGMDEFDLFAASFPAGTVSGAPKIRAMEILDELEPVRRGLYAGTVGYFGHGGSMDQAIAIRTLQFSGGRVALQAGAGIVADSVADREFDEVLAKSRGLRAALELAAQKPEEGGL
ncbi:MAG: anthranilate synthase component I family protein [Bradymonadia bacterium]